VNYYGRAGPQKEIFEEEPSVPHRAAWDMVHCFLWFQYSISRSTRQDQDLRIQTWLLVFTTRIDLCFCYFNFYLRPPNEQAGQEVSLRRTKDKNKIAQE
jgi:hypothetical protein